MSIENGPPGFGDEQPIGLRHSMAALEAAKLVRPGNELQEASMAELWNFAVHLDADELARQAAQEPTPETPESEL